MRFLHLDWLMWICFFAYGCELHARAFNWRRTSLLGFIEVVGPLQEMLHEILAGTKRVAAARKLQDADWTDEGSAS